MSSCITIREREHTYKFTRWCDPPGENTDKTLQQERNIQARKALQMKKKPKPVEGCADGDIREIEEADQIRLCAISAIQALLNA